MITKNFELGLLESLKEGDEKAFNYFFHLYYKSLSLFSFRIINDEDVAEEIVQDTFIKLWERHKDFSHPSALKSFLFTTVRNASLNWLRKQKRESLLVAQQIFLANTSEQPVLNTMIAAETYTEVHTAINNLPPQCSRIFRMIFFEGKDYPQIAAELKLTISTIRNQKARALTLLRQQLGITVSALYYFFLFCF